MPRRARAAVLPVSLTLTANPLAWTCAIQSLQQPQVGLFQTSICGACARCAPAHLGRPTASAPSTKARRPAARSGEVTLLLLELGLADLAARVAPLQDLERRLRGGARRCRRARGTATEQSHEHDDAEDDQHPPEEPVDHPEAP